MNRHHPYGGYDGPPRRGGPAFPERQSRFDRGGGPPRGRGGRGGPPPRGGYGEFGPSGYDGYDHGPPPMNGSYGNGEFYQDEYPGDGYDTGRFEDGPSNGRPPRRRRERTDEVHDSLIEERIQRERPCRTLFIRNIKYETDSADVRRRFEEHGEIKTFFDLISSRGMVFVTYFDLRAAERAREKLQGTELAGRPIDVHYSLPRGDEQNQRCDRDKNQGSLLVTLRHTMTGNPLPVDDNEIRRKFQQFGDVKSVKPAGGPEQRIVELFDTRACEEAHDHLQHQGLQEGVMEITFTWDVPDQPLPPGPIPRRPEHSPPPRPHPHDEPRGGRGRRPRARGNRAGRDKHHDDWDGGYGPGPGPSPRDNYGPPRGRRENEDYGRDRHDDRFDQRGNDRYGPPPSGYPPYGGPGPQGPPENRFEQARKVQQLLAALKQPASDAPPSQQQVAPPPSAPRQAPMQPVPPQANAGMPTYYPPPPAPQPQMHPQQSQQPPYPPPPPAVQTYPPVPHQQQYPTYPPPPAIVHPQHMPMPPPAAAAQPAPQPPAPLTGLPPNLLALLQQNATAQQTPPPQHQSPPVPAAQPPQYNAAGAVPQHVPAANYNILATQSPPVATMTSSAQVQQLMALLAQQKHG